MLVRNGKEAIKLYEDIFGAKLVEHQPFSKEVGAQFGLPDDFDYENSTMHAEIEIGGAIIYLSDNMGAKLESSSNVEIVLDLDNKEQIESIYNKAKKIGSKINMELQKMFWGAYYAKIVDPLGIGWQLTFAEE
ncbi:MAG: VOC family protein [Candidatus Hodarchaeales archaeon]|jgi:PhnB protein